MSLTISSALRDLHICMCQKIIITESIKKKLQARSEVSLKERRTGGGGGGGGIGSISNSTAGGKTGVV